MIKEILAETKLRSPRINYYLANNCHFDGFPLLIPTRKPSSNKIDLNGEFKQGFTILKIYN